MFAEELFKKVLGALEAFLGEDDRSRFANRIRDVPFFVESLHGCPVEAFPRASSLV
jgi:hypothetical protein